MSCQLMLAFSFYWATVCKTVRPMLSVRCLSVCPVCLLSVTFVHCGQTVGRIKTKLGMQVGLGPGRIVLDGDPVPPPKEAQPSAPNFRTISVAAKWCMDQDVNWCGARPRPRPLCVKWGPRSPSQGGSPPNFRPMIIAAKRMDG